MKLPSNWRTLLVPAAFFIVTTSCTRALYEASLDGTKRKNSGESYSTGYSDASDVGFNLMAMFFAGATGLTPGGDIPKKAARIGETEALFLSENRSGTDNEMGYMPSAPSGFKEKLQLFTGVGLVLKNSKDEEIKIHTSYLEVPVYLTYLHPLENGGNVFGGLGPYFAYGLGGKIKGPGFSQKSFDKDNGLKRFDAGLALTAGYIFPGGFHGRIGYDLGLADIDRIDGDRTKNRTFSLNVGAPLGRLIKSK
jgi:hypothetical protein